MATAGRELTMHPPEDACSPWPPDRPTSPTGCWWRGVLDDCAACRATLAEISAPGGALLASLSPEPPTDGLWESLRARVAALPPGPGPDDPRLAGVPLPQGARRRAPLPHLAWHNPLARGARMALLLRDDFTGSRLILGHMPARRAFPRHLHLGPEDVLVLAGGYEDQMGTFETGAYASYAPGTEHRPFTEPDEECWILFRLEKPNLFFGWRGWAQRLLRLA